MLYALFGEEIINKIYNDYNETNYSEPKYFQNTINKPKYIHFSIYTFYIHTSTLTMNNVMYTLQISLYTLKVIQ